MGDGAPAAEPVDARCGRAYRSTPKANRHQGVAMACSVRKLKPALPLPLVSPLRMPAVR